MKSNKNIQILMVDRNYLNKMMADLPGLAGVSEDIDGLAGVEKHDDTEDEDAFGDDDSFKAGYLKGYEDALKDAMETDKE